MCVRERGGGRREREWGELTEDSMEQLPVDAIIVSLNPLCELNANICPAAPFISNQTEA